MNEDVFKEVKSFLDKNKIVYYEESDWSITVTDIGNVKIDSGEWDSFWQSKKDILIHVGPTRDNNQSASWNIKIISNSNKQQS